MGPTANHNSLKKYLLILVGSLSVAIGFMGVVVPLLPTTPFLLLAAYCYLRSSKRLYGWLINHRIFGEYIDNYLNYRAVKRPIKICALALLWLSLGLSYLVVDNVIVHFLLLLVGIGVSIHLLMLRTLPGLGSQSLPATKD